MFVMLVSVIVLVLLVIRVMLVALVMEGVLLYNAGNASRAEAGRSSNKVGLVIRVVYSADK